MHTHNLPTTPGALLGYRKDGRPFYLIAGGSGEDGGNDGNSNEGGQGDAGNGDAGQNDSGNDGGSGSGSRDDAGSGRDDRGRYSSRDGGGRDGDDQHTNRTVAAIREDFKTERGKRQAAEKELAGVKKAQQDLQAALDADKADQAKKMDALAVALGVKSGDEPPDPEKLAAELKAAQEKAQNEIGQRDSALRERTIELAILRNAGKNGANGDALLDSRSFMAKVNGLDPSAGSFGDDLADAIKAAMENGPQYKAAGSSVKGDDGKGNGSDGKEGDGGKKPPARSGGEHTAPGGNRQWTVDEARTVAKRDPKALEQAIENGLLVDIGYPPSKFNR